MGQVKLDINVYEKINFVDAWIKFVASNHGSRFISLLKIRAVLLKIRKNLKFREKFETCKRQLIKFLRFSTNLHYNGHALFHQETRLQALKATLSLKFGPSELPKNSRENAIKKKEINHLRVLHRIIW